LRARRRIAALRRLGHAAGVTLLIQALPLLALVGLLASGRAGPIIACTAAIVLTFPAAVGALPNGMAGLPGFAVASGLQGLFLALIPVGVMAGGLLFHAATAQRGGGEPGPAGDRVAVLFDSAFLLGPFTEAVTGFGVGSVFAVGALRRIGVEGAAAAAIAMLAQIAVPWGGLGPGTAVGAALAGISPQAMATRNAVQLAAALPFLLLLFWHYAAAAGVPIAARQRVGHAMWLAALAALLVGCHFVVPWEVCGLLATGPLLAARMLRANPPRNRGAWVRAAAGAAPYLLLAAILLGRRLWANPPSWQPYPDLPPLPLNHAMVALWVVVLGLLATRRDGIWVARQALARMPRTAIVLLLFVLLARTLGNAGIPQALASALAGAFDGWAPYAAPLLAAGGGFVTGTNTGGNSAMMPLQSALGRAAGLGATVLPAVQNGTLTLLMAPQLTAVVVHLAGGGARLGQVWRLSWPVALIGILIGMAAVAIG
jgi:lactate permease